MEEQKHAKREDYAKIIARKQLEYAKVIAERDQYAESNAEIMELIKGYETFLARHPAQLAQIRRRMR